MGGLKIRDVARCDCLAIRQAARQITQHYERHMSNEGLTANQYAILRKLSGLGPLSIGDLAGSMVMDATTVTRALGPLTRDGLLEIARTKDLRRRLVGLTRQGHAKLRSADKHWRAAQDAFERSFGAADAEAMRQTMWRVVESVPTAE